MIVECPGCERRYDVTGRPPGTKARCRCSTVFVLPEPTQSAGSLSCPKCGGGVAIGAHHCEFCQAELLVKACPRCFSRIFHGARHCNECGAEVEVPANANPDGSAAALVCPRCESSPVMEARLVGDTLMDECPECRGVWLDSAAVERLVRERRQISTQAVLGMGGGPVGYTLPINPVGRVYVKCPDCASMMNRTNFAKRSGIIVDSCRNHGTWFDADELPRIVDFVMKGGVEASHVAEVAQGRQEARNAMSKARQAQAQAALDMSTTRTRSTSGAFVGMIETIGWILSS